MHRPTQRTFPMLFIVAEALISQLSGWWVRKLDGGLCHPPPCPPAGRFLGARCLVRNCGSFLSYTVCAVWSTWGGSSCRKYWRYCCAYPLPASSAPWVGRGEEYLGLMCTYTQCMRPFWPLSVSLLGVDRLALQWAVLSGPCLNSLVSFQKINDRALAIHHSHLMQPEHQLRDIGGRQSFSLISLKLHFPPLNSQPLQILWYTGGISVCFLLVILLVLLPLFVLTHAEFKYLCFNPHIITATFKKRKSFTYIHCLRKSTFAIRP